MSKIDLPLDGVQVVSFDVFDTALARYVLHPTDLFLYVGDYLTDSTAAAFREARVQAERAARLANPEREITLDDIYAQLDLPADEAAMLQQLELTAEGNFCQANAHVLAAYRACLVAGKRVVFTSDMYLPPQTVAAMLEKCGYDRYERLLVSSEYGVTKHNGGLFDVLIQQVNVPASAILHVGDNPHSDVHRARERGLQAVHIPKNRDHTRNHGDPLRVAHPVTQRYDLAESVAAGLCANRYAALTSSDPPSGEALWYWFGYRYVGLALYGFTRWLVESARTDGVDCLYFLARDGHLLHRLYQQYDAYALTGIDCAYLYGSRRAMAFPATFDLTQTELTYLLNNVDSLTVAEIFAGFGVTLDADGSRLAAAGFDSPAQQISFRTQPELRNHLRNLYLLYEDEILAQAATERDTLTAYLQQERFFDQRRVGLIDVGWHGSMQYALWKLLRDSHPDLHITGYYVGLNYHPQRYSFINHLDMRGYLLDKGQPPAHHAILKHAAELFEFFLSAPHGTTIGYQRHNGQIEPLLAPDPADDYRRSGYEAVQRGANDFMTDMLATVGTVPVTPTAALRTLAEFIQRPTADEARLFGDLQHATSMTGDTGLAPLARPAVTGLAALSPGALRDDYARAFWPQGYRARLNPVSRRLLERMAPPPDDTQL